MMLGCWVWVLPAGFFCEFAGEGAKHPMVGGGVCRVLRVSRAASGNAAQAGSSASVLRKLQPHRLNRSGAPLVHCSEPFFTQSQDCFALFTLSPIQRRLDLRMLIFCENVFC